MFGARKLKPFGRGGSLVMIAGLLFVSGLIRIGIEASPALARDPEEPKTSDNAEMADKPADSMPDREGLHAVLEAIREREERLVERERLLEEKAYALEIADQAVTRKLEELKVAEAALRETLALADGAVEADVARLTSVYEAMKPKEAAALFEEMAPEFAAGFLVRMRPDVAAEVMTGLSPEAAYTISVLLAGRHSKAPIE